MIRGFVNANINGVAFPANPLILLFDQMLLPRIRDIFATIAA